MIRFITNLLLYGLFFFLIYKFLPETFNTLVIWVNHIFDFLANVVLWAIDKIQLIFHSATAK
jgi:hypothetical protein